MKVICISEGDRGWNREYMSSKQSQITGNCDPSPKIKTIDNQSFYGI